MKGWKKVCQTCFVVLFLSLMVIEAIKCNTIDNGVNIGGGLVPKSGGTVYSPDDKGAVGDGVTIDDKAFLEGDYVYELKDGKTYRVSEWKLRRIINNKVIGDGTIKYYKDYANPESVHGVTSFTKSADESSNNRFMECITAYVHANTWSSTQIGNRYKKQQPKYPSDRLGEYHEICAIYIDEDNYQNLPDQFTICFGQYATWQRKSGGDWEKTIANVELGGIGNYRLPWTGNKSRRFNHEVEVFDDHCELVVDKEELTSWLGGNDGGQEGCVHFWSKNYYFQPGGYDDLLFAWNLWVKEPEAANLLYANVDIDASSRHPDAGSNKTGKEGSSIWLQLTGSPSMPITDSPQLFWGSTLDVDQCKAVDVREMSAELGFEIYEEPEEFEFEEDDSMEITATRSGSSIFDEYAAENLLEVAPFDSITSPSGKYILSHDDNDIYTLEVVDGGSAWTEIDLSPYLLSVPDIAKDERFRFTVELIDGNPAYLGNFFYDKYKNYSVTLNADKSIGEDVYSDTAVATGNFKPIFKFGTNAKSLSDITRFRIVLTKE